MLLRYSSRKWFLISAIKPNSDFMSTDIRRIICLHLKFECACVRFVSVVVSINLGPNSIFISGHKRLIRLNSIDHLFQVYVCTAVLAAVISYIYKCLSSCSYLVWIRIRKTYPICVDLGSTGIINHSQINWKCLRDTWVTSICHLICNNKRTYITISCCDCGSCICVNRVVTMCGADKLLRSMGVWQRIVSCATRICEWDSWHILALSLVCVGCPCYCKISWSGYIYHIFWIGIWCCSWQIPCWEARIYHSEIHCGCLKHIRIRFVSHRIFHYVGAYIATLGCNCGGSVSRNCRGTTRSECLSSMRNRESTVSSKRIISDWNTRIILTVSCLIIWCPIDCKGIWHC